MTIMYTMITFDVIKFKLIDHNSCTFAESERMGGVVPLG